MAKKQSPWSETQDGYVVVIDGRNGTSFVAFAEDQGQALHRRAFYRRYADALRVKRKEMSLFKTRIEKATLTITARQKQ